MSVPDATAELALAVINAESFLLNLSYDDFVNKNYWNLLGAFFFFAATCNNELSETPNLAKNIASALKDLLEDPQICKNGLRL